MLEEIVRLTDPTRDAGDETLAQRAKRHAEERDHYREKLALAEGRFQGAQEGAAILATQLARAQARAEARARSTIPLAEPPKGKDSD